MFNARASPDRRIGRSSRVRINAIVSPMRGSSMRRCCAASVSPNHARQVVSACSTEPPTAASSRNALDGRGSGRGAPDHRCSLHSRLQRRELGALGFHVDDGCRRGSGEDLMRLVWRNVEPLAFIPPKYHFESASAAARRAPRRAAPHDGDACPFPCQARDRASGAARDRGESSAGRWSLVCQFIQARRNPGVGDCFRLEAVRFPYFLFTEAKGNSL